MTQVIELRFDGGTSGGNPGRGYGSYQFRHVETGRQVIERVVFEDLGLLTNNEAEYLTLVQALHRLALLYRERGPDVRLVVIGDSQIVLRQVSGQYHCGIPTLAALRAAVQSLLDRFAGWETTWVPRTQMFAVFGH